MTAADAPNMEYLRTKVLTASPQELMLMLYDGAIKFAEQAKDAMVNEQFDVAHERFVRAQNIVLELSSSLRHEVDPDLCGKMASLYNFVYRRLIEGNLNRNAQAVDEALKILNFQRETWMMLLDKLAQEQAQQTPTDQPVEVGSLSVSA